MTPEEIAREREASFDWLVRWFVAIEGHVFSIPEDHLKERTEEHLGRLLAARAHSAAAEPMCNICNLGGTMMRDGKEGFGHYGHDGAWFGPCKAKPAPVCGTCGGDGIIRTYTRDNDFLEEDCPTCTPSTTKIADPSVPTRGGATASGDCASAGANENVAAAPGQTGPGPSDAGSVPPPRTLPQGSVDEAVSKVGTGPTSAWLIERGQAVNHKPTLWWCGPGPHDYTENANAAAKFRTRDEAQRKLESQGMHFVESARVTEHVFMEPTSAQGACVGDKIAVLIDDLLDEEREVSLTKYGSIDRDHRVADRDKARSALEAAIVEERDHLQGELDRIRTNWQRQEAAEREFRAKAIIATYERTLGAPVVGERAGVDVERLLVELDREWPRCAKQVRSIAARLAKEAVAEWNKRADLIDSTQRRGEDEEYEHAVKELRRAAESYMKYHAEKFYGDGAIQPTGLWPAIRKFDQANAARRSREAKG